MSGIGPTIEGLRTGQRVRVNDPTSAFHERVGHIVAIEQDTNEVYWFYVDCALKSGAKLRLRRGQLVAVDDVPNDGPLFRQKARPE